MFKHYGATPIKYIFSIHVTTVSLPDMEFEGAECFCVSYERGGKRKTLQYSAEKTIILVDNDNLSVPTVEFDENFKTEATLYKDSKTEKFQEKMCMLSVLQRKKGTSGLKKGGYSKDCFKTIGVVNLPLHEVADGTIHDLLLPLSWCVSEQASIHVVISAMDKENASETSSMQDTDSVADDNSVVSASDSNSYTSHSTHPPTSTPALGIKLFSKASRPPPAIPPQPAGIPPTISEEYDGNYSYGADNRGEIKDFSNDREPSSNSKPPLARLTPTTLRLHSGVQDRQSSLLNDSAVGIGSFEHSNEYQEMKRTIEQLEGVVLASEEIVKHERGRAKDALQRAGQAERALAKMNQQVNQEGQQNAEIEKLLSELDILKKQNAALIASTQRVQQESTRLQQLQSTLEAELDNLQTAKANLDSALTVSRDENQILLGELINAKMAVGNLSSELDEANRQLRLLRASGVNNSNVASTPDHLAVTNGNRRPPPANNMFANTTNGGPSGSNKQNTPQNMKPQVIINPFSDINSPLNGTSVLMRGFGSSSNNTANNSSNQNKETPAPVKNPFAAMNTSNNYNNNGNMTNNAAAQHQQYLQQQRQSLQLQQQKRSAH
mmetsp:Transcript_25145/g.36105  ORF Transcript_25145/g.36105 Transcript_25145/m.36105 type:complete len:608 (+) Transcript_25145:53-1876(+)